MKVHTITTYSFAELDDKAKDRAIDKLFDVNVSHDWWKDTFDDADRIGLKLDSFELDYRHSCKGKFDESAVDTAERILLEHGETCPTYLLAKKYLHDLSIVLSIQKMIYDVDKVTNQDFEVIDKFDTLNNKFLEDLLDYYYGLLKDEYENYTSRDAIIETIVINDYEFTPTGDLARWTN